MTDEDLAQALAAIDAANADDPEELVVRGTRRPKELAHAELASHWVETLAPDASAALRLAARAHHVRRWEIPRTQYPRDRAGYLRWRRELQAHHARTVRSILESQGVDGETVSRVEDLVCKRGLGRDREVQVLEDALCLVFLETQLEDLVAREGRDKVRDILRKTLRKMSASGIEATSRIDLGAPERELLAEAAAGAGS